MMCVSLRVSSAMTGVFPLATLSIVIFALVGELARPTPYVVPFMMLPQPASGVTSSAVSARTENRMNNRLMRVGVEHAETD